VEAFTSGTSGSIRFAAVIWSVVNTLWKDSSAIGKDVVS
jgi:hypothetical protein